MTQSLLIQISPESLKEMISEAVSSAMATQNQKAEDGYLTRKEVCERLSITLPTLHTYVNNSQLKALKINGRTLFRKADIESALTEKIVCKHRRVK